MSEEKQLDIEDVAGDGSHLAQETLDALDGLDSEADQETESLAQDVANQEQSAADRQAEEQARKNAAMMTAAGAVALMEKGLQMKWDFVAFEQQQKVHLVQALAPVFEKHGGGMPAWLVPYKEEFSAAVALGGALFGVYMQVKAHEASREQEPERESNKRQQHSSAPAPVTQPETPTSASILDLGKRMQEPQE